MTLPVTAPAVNHTAVDWTEQDFGLILREYNVDYNSADNYWQVGQLNQVQGWILDLSFVLYQLPAALEMIVPVLIAEDVPFRIIQDQQTAADFMHGYVGIEKIGKMVTIFCPDESRAADLAVTLVSVTKDLKGPAVLTDKYLGGTVYARYGGFNPVLLQTEKGKKEPHIYAPDGTLVPDTEPMPFILITGIAWPFGRLAKVDTPPAKKILQHVYRPVSVLKEDVRGNVFKGLYLKSLFRVKNCVIKQGKKGMTSDLYGRDMHHRLAWQQDIHTRLKGTIPLPEIYDLFVEDGDTYLVMEYINGSSLYDKVKEINNGSLCWRALTAGQQLSILSFVIEIVVVIGDFHDQGYIHRDVHPGNFMVDKKNKLYLIDIELAYSVQQEAPDPPFTYGTSGFMSPEQQEIQTPSIKEDIYGIGATMINMLSGVSPVKFEHAGKESLAAKLELLIGDSPVTNMILRCIDADPEVRPELVEILSTLKNYENALKNQASLPIDKAGIAARTESLLPGIIHGTLYGLVEEPIIISGDLWYFKVTKEDNYGVPQMREYTKYPGLRNGMAGVLFMLSKAFKAGFNTGHLREQCEKSKAYLQDYLADQTGKANDGFYDGRAGVGVALAACISAGMLEDNEEHRSLVRIALGGPGATPEDITLATGTAGKGLAILHCQQYLAGSDLKERIGGITADILIRQDGAGLWTRSGSKKQKDSKANISLGEGDAGIIWYLLNAHAMYPDVKVRHALEKALAPLVKIAGTLSKGSLIFFFDKNGYGKRSGDELPGLLLVLIRAYEVLKFDEYRHAAEKVLNALPYGLISNNFSSWNGLASLGEIYLSAWQVFGNEEWKERADWLASLYLHLHGNNPGGSNFWMIEESDAPTASFMTGTSGIIHFLIRRMSGGKGFYLY